MCSTCGCNQADSSVLIQRPGQPLDLKGLSFSTGDQDQSNGHDHHDNQDHGSDHSHRHYAERDDPNQRVIELERDILHKNDLLAERNRGYFEARDILALNLVSSPGSGKTTLLERSLSDLQSETPFYVIEGDQQSMQDANRIAALDVPVVQINTGKGCHLDAKMVHDALVELNPGQGSTLMIENVGNLVCPSMFDLGEKKRVVIMSVTEGADKPLKYPDMFHGSDVCLINKIDLLPYVDFDVAKAREYAMSVNRHLEFFELSATTGEGMEAWYAWLRQQVPNEQSA